MTGAITKSFLLVCLMSFSPSAAAIWASRWVFSGSRFLDDFWRRMAMKSPTTMDKSETTPDSLLWTFFCPSAAPAFTEPPRQQGFQTTRRNARRDAAENTLYYDDRASAAQRYAARSTSPLTLFCETTPHDITQTRSG